MMFPMLAAAALAAQAAPAPVSPGTITVELPVGDVSADTAPVFRDAVAGALAGVDFTPLPPPGRGRYRAQVTVVRRQQGSVTSRVARDRTAPLVGGWGAAVTVPLGRTGTRTSPLIVTELQVRILRRDGGPVLWTGRALTAQPQDTPGDRPEAVADKLAEALAGVFPQQGETAISVP